MSWTGAIFWRSAACILAAGLAQAAHADCTSISDNTARLACFDKEMAAASPLQWSGNGSENLPPFQISGPWTLHWRSDGPIAIGISTTAGAEEPDQQVTSQTAGESQSYETFNGTIYLTIPVSLGSWSIWVTPAN